MPLWQPQAAALLIRRPGLRPLIGTNFTSHRPADTYGQLIYDATPVAYYRLDGDTTDLMGNAAGVLHGSAGYGTAVVSYSGAQAGSFNGSTDYVQVADQVQSRLGDPLTVEAWVVPSSTSAGFHGIAGNVDALMERDGANFTLFTQGIGSAIGTTTITAGQPYHLAAVWSGGTATLYVNGQVDATQGYGSVVSSTFGFFIGSYNGASEFFDGRIDEVAYYNRALPLAEVQAHYAAGGPVAASAAGSITLDATSAAAAQPMSSGSLTLNGSGVAQAPAASTAGISLSGTVTGQARAAATGSLSLSGASAPTASGSAAGSLTLGGSGGAPTGSAVATGSLQLGGSATPAANAGAGGALTLGSPGATAAGAGSAGGQISLSGTGTATQPGSHANGSLALDGGATAQATPSAVGGLSLNGSPAAQVTATATGGAIQLGGPSAAGASASSNGSITLAGAAQLSALAQAAGQIQLGGLATGTALGAFRDITLTVGSLATRTLSGSITARTLTGSLATRTLTGRLET